MFEGLQKKWGVSGIRFVLIFCVFALGGSLTGFAGKKLMPLLAIDQPVLYWFFYILLVTVIWPFCILVVSIPFGQFRFFWNYEKKLWRFITRKNKK
jgi:hypothetical protein